VASAGSNEISFTILTISISLIAVFAPLIFMGGVVGVLVREFAVPLSCGGGPVPRFGRAKKAEKQTSLGRGRAISCCAVDRSYTRSVSIETGVCASVGTSSAQTRNPDKTLGPKVCVKGTSAASRP
jgi:hypothetical protein